MDNGPLNTTRRLGFKKRLICNLKDAVGKKRRGLCRQAGSSISCLCAGNGRHRKRPVCMFVKQRAADECGALT